MPVLVLLLVLLLWREHRKKRLPVGSAACHAVEQQENRAVTANGAVQAGNSSVVWAILRHASGLVLSIPPDLVSRLVRQSFQPPSTEDGAACQCGIASPVAGSRLGIGSIMIRLQARL